MCFDIHVTPTGIFIYTDEIALKTQHEEYLQMEDSLSRVHNVLKDCCRTFKLEPEPTKTRNG